MRGGTARTQEEQSMSTRAITDRDIERAIEEAKDPETHVFDLRKVAKIIEVEFGVSAREAKRAVDDRDCRHTSTKDRRMAKVAAARKNRKKEWWQEVSYALDEAAMSLQITVGSIEEDGIGEYERCLAEFDAAVAAFRETMCGKAKENAEAKAA
jgi:hypothetical protein